MHDYQDFEKCIILRNAELKKMYCFDKKKRLITLETNDNDEFTSFLRDKYDVNEIKWEFIDYEN